MKIKGLLLASLALSLVACSNATNTDTVASGNVNRGVKRRKRKVKDNDSR